MNREMLTLYGLKWNPFSTDLPVDGLMTTPAVENFCRRVERHLVRQGGFALIGGPPGIGKSVALRLLAERLERIDRLSVAVLTHPSSSVADFYHEISDRFAITMAHNNRWNGIKGLRQRWLDHLDDTRMRPLLLVDEAQELPNAVLTEMRLLSSTDFDSRTILGVVLAGDNRLLAKLRTPELHPIDSRIRQRLLMTRPEDEDLLRLLDHLLEEAGNPALMTAGLKDTLVAHAGGNPRTLTVMADALLAAGADQDREVLDEKLFLETWGEPTKTRRARR
ncbi:MAG: ATP-binding protein [Gemmatimonadetes bacterium]|nr:ATP-binding protein [Alphaproteobacteria bacterium]MXV94535.1 ATP-binding protein [Gemmatimonadota bacterium]MYE17136.1 ATP-binding protein [Gemmatimonadota bacterium]